MKKLLILTGIICMLFGASGYAASGDIAGNIYSTDIRAYINGVEVPSYNIGGQTAVVIEDILEHTDYYAYSYQDSIRTLLLNDLSPKTLISGSSPLSDMTGNIIGNIYETDIKTYVYDKVITSYNIGGKTAVAIEDLGNDSEFSDICGKYIWNEADRTISLEFMYNTDFIDILRDNDLSIVIAGNQARLKSDPFYSGSIIGEATKESVEEIDGNMRPIVMSVGGENVLIGYRGRKQKYNFASDDYNDDTVNSVHLEPDTELLEYFYVDKLKVAIDNTYVKPLTRDEVIEHYIIDQAIPVKDRIDTDDYSFLYLLQSTNHGGNDILLRVGADGREHNYANDFEPVSLWTIEFENVRIDKENEKVYLHYDVDYIIDLKTGALYPASGEAVSSYPEIPKTDRAHYIIYKEGYRDNRVELAVFDTNDNAVIWNNRVSGEEHSLYTKGEYRNDIKYYLDGDKWVEFERGYERVSSNAYDVIESDLDVTNARNNYIYLFGKK